ncbi:MAG TPA: GAF domain-containing protein [Methylomirabilota bacterium]|jgi:signal transduction histidine kinase|nr:GAF domain-containing protein [Methylomirabilota bacterium]
MPELATLPPRLETLLEMSRQLSRILPLDALLGKMAEACGSLLDSDSVGIRVVDGDDLVLMGVWGDAHRAMPTPRIKIGESLTGTVVATGKPLLLSDPANDPRIAPASRIAYLRGGYRAFLGVPLKIGEQVLGALSIRTLRAEGFSSEDVSIATAFAAQAAIALDNARLYREAEARADKLKALSALTRLMTSAEGAREVCQAVARAATSLLGAASTRVSVADPTARVLRTEGGFSLDPHIEQIVTEVPVIPYGEGLTGRIAESRTPDFILDIGQDPQLRNRRLSSVAGLRGFAGLPLIADDQTVGVLAIFFREPRSFTSEEQELMALLADQAAIAIRNARMRQALQTRQSHLEALLEVSRQLSKIQPVESLLATISEACGRLLDSESVGFRRVEGDELVLAGSWGDAKEVLVTSRLKVGESLSGRVAVGGEPLLVADLANDHRVTAAHRESCSRRGYRAMLAVPVKVGERVVGVLTILSRRPEGFCAEDLIMATAFAAQAAVALENSRLYQETQRAYEELAQTQGQLAQAGKMEAIGHLAGGVAHDFNNLLMVIMGRTELLLNDLDATDPKRSTAKIIEQTAQRAADLTRQLLAFSRKQVLNPVVLDLNAVVPKMGEMLRRLIGEDIDLVTVLGSALGHVKADPGQIEQIIMNLAVNARDAMPEGGRLTLETANVDLDAGYARKHVGARPGPHVMLALSDTGIGMDAQTQAHIFEPFFTTKGPRKGTGLGLAMVYGIVKQSGGNIWVYSEPGKGASFKIYLPRIEEPIDDSHAGSSLPAPAHGVETILLVEDEDTVRDLTRDILEAHGYTVLEARHGAEALRISEQHSGAIDLMLTDVVMPEMGGREVAERLAVQRPETKVLYMSGYTDSAVVHHGVLDASTAFLQKPFSATVLVRKLREILGVHPA